MPIKICTNVRPISTVRHDETRILKRHLSFIVTLDAPQFPALLLSFFQRHISVAFGLDENAKRIMKFIATDASVNLGKNGFLSPRASRRVIKNSSSLTPIPIIPLNNVAQIIDRYERMENILLINFARLVAPRRIKM